MDELTKEDFTIPPAKYECKYHISYFKYNITLNSSNKDFHYVRNNRQPVCRYTGIHFATCGLVEIES